MVNKFWKVNESVMKYIEDRDPTLAILIKGESEEKEEVIVNRSGGNDRYKILTRQNWKCNICGQKLKYKKNSPWGGEVAHIDHIHPFTKKSTYPNGEANINEPTNLQALCPDCNLKKGKKEIQ